MGIWKHLDKNQQTIYLYGILMGVLVCVFLVAGYAAVNQRLLVTAMNHYGVGNVEYACKTILAIPTNCTCAPCPPPVRGIWTRPPFNLTINTSGT